MSNLGRYLLLELRADYNSRMMNSDWFKQLTDEIPDEIRLIINLFLSFPWRVKVGPKADVKQVPNTTRAK